MLILDYHIEIDRQRRREQREAVRWQRLVAVGRSERRIRRAVGRSMIRIGSRLAADRVR